MVNALLLYSRVSSLPIQALVVVHVERRSHCRFLISSLHSVSALLLSERERERETWKSEGKCFELFEKG